MRNSSMGPPGEFDPTSNRPTSGHSTTDLRLTPTPTRLRKTLLQIDILPLSNVSLPSLPV